MRPRPLVFASSEFSFQIYCFFAPLIDGRRNLGHALDARISAPQATSKGREGVVWNLSVQIRCPFVRIWEERKKGKEKERRATIVFALCVQPHIPVGGFICRSVRPSVSPSVRPSVGPPVVQSVRPSVRYHFLCCGSFFVYNLGGFTSYGTGPFVF